MVLAKTHPRRPAGGRSADPGDLPTRTSSYAKRDLAAVRRPATSPPAVPTVTCILARKRYGVTLPLVSMDLKGRLRKVKLGSPPDTPLGPLALAGTREMRLIRRPSRRRQISGDRGPVEDALQAAARRDDARPPVTDCSRHGGLDPHSHGR